MNFTGILGMLLVRSCADELTRAFIRRSRGSDQEAFTSQDLPQQFGAWYSEWLFFGDLLGGNGGWFSR